MSISINDNQWNIFKILLDSDDALTLDQLVSRTDLDYPLVTATALLGEEQGWLNIDESFREELIPSEKAVEQLKKKLPEREILSAFESQDTIAMSELAKTAKENNIPMNEIIKWGSGRGWFEKNKGELVITEKGRNAMEFLDDDERALDLALQHGTIFMDELPDKGIDAEIVKKLLLNRTALAKIKKRTIRTATVTGKGRAELQTVQHVTEKNTLTSEEIQNGDWKNITLRNYDVTLETEKVYPAKIHMMQKIIQLTRKSFLEMGFTEIVSPQVESAFWDFDALFQPQDHPARDMQDTFYLERPHTAKLPDDTIVNNVKLTHENGWETGSTGWGYNWDPKRAQQIVLRTHTTAATIRALAENPNPPRKVFCVGKVYRNESISYKHLPEFFQVDGIIIDKEASLSTLLGTLKEFYRKMGFDRVKFKPAFFPYTEPSAEVFVFMESKNSWIELGGAGIFRPEVTRPFGCTVPVLAWGLGLDRLAMIRYGINDIRELYWSDLDKIKEVSLCQ